MSDYKTSVLSVDKESFHDSYMKLLFCAIPSYEQDYQIIGHCVPIRLDKHKLSQKKLGQYLIQGKGIDVFLKANLARKEFVLLFKVDDKRILEFDFYAFYALVSSSVSASKKGSTAIVPVLSNEVSGPALYPILLSALNALTNSFNQEWKIPPIEYYEYVREYFDELERNGFHIKNKN